MNYKVLDDTDDHVVIQFVDTHTFKPPLRGLHEPTPNPDYFWTFLGISFLSRQVPDYNALYWDSLIWLPGLQVKQDSDTLHIPYENWALIRPALDICMYAINANMRPSDCRQ